MNSPSPGLRRAVVSSLSFALLMALAIAVAIGASPAAAERGDLRVKPTLFKKDDRIRVEVRGARGSECKLRVRAGSSGAKLGDLTLDNDGRGAWQWVMPKDAPGGKWRFKVSCERASGDVDRGSASLRLKPGGKQDGELIAPSTAEVSAPEGAGAGANRYAWKQCTWYVKEVYPEVPNGWGDAHGWDDGARRAGWPVYDQPKPGSIAVWEAWGSVRTGHVAIVTAVHPDGFINIKEHNWNTRLGYGERNRIGTARTSGARGNPQWFICPPGRCGERDRSPQFDDIRVHSSNTLTVGAGQKVSAVVTARYLGPDAIPCGQINLGVRGDTPARYADISPGPWPASPWRSPTRVAIAGCNGSLTPGQYATWNLSFKPPANAPAGVTLTGVFAPVWEHVAWSGQNIPISLDVRKTGELGTYPPPDPNAPPFAAQFVDQKWPRIIDPGETATVEIQVRNVGRSQWDENVRLATPDDGAIRHVSGGTVSGSTNRVPFTDAEGDGLVAPGGIATFEYEITAPAQATAYRQRFELVREVIGPRFGGQLGMYIPTVVADETHFPPELTAADCTWSFVTQAGSPIQNGWVQVKSSTASEWSFTIRNSSDLCPWFETGPYAAHLATRRPQDRGSSFADTSVGWINPTRVKLPQTVAPGQTVQIPMALRSLAGVAPGDYPEFMAPVIEGKFHLADQGMFIPVRRVP